MKNLKLGLLALTLMLAFSLSAQKKISQLPELVIPDSTDVLPIVNDGVTKKIQVNNLLKLSISNDSLSIGGGNTVVLPSGGGSGDNFANADLTLTGDRVHDTDNNNLEFKNNDTKIVLKNIMIDDELLLFAGNIITHVDGSDTIIMYDGIVHKPDFESFMLQQITYNSLVLYSEKLYTEGQKVVYSPGKSFSIDGELVVSTGRVIFTDAEYLKPPNWTTLERPVSPEVSVTGYNTDLNQMEYWNSTTWVQF